MWIQSRNCQNHAILFFSTVDSENYYIVHLVYYQNVVWNLDMAIACCFGEQLEYVEAQISL